MLVEANHSEAYPLHIVHEVVVVAAATLLLHAHIPRIEVALPRLVATTHIGINHHIHSVRLWPVAPVLCRGVGLAHEGVEELSVLVPEVVYEGDGALVCHILPIFQELLVGIWLRWLLWGWLVNHRLVVGAAATYGAECKESKQNEIK